MCPEREGVRLEDETLCDPFLNHCNIFFFISLSSSETFCFYLNFNVGDFIIKKKGFNGEKEINEAGQIIFLFRSATFL